MRGLLFLISILSFSFWAQSQTTVNGIIDKNTTWTVANSPYEVEGTTLVKEGVRLVVEPGVIVNSDGKVTMTIDGELHAVGTSDSVIEFNDLSLEISEKAVEFILSLQKGTQFDHVAIKRTSYGRGILVRGTDLMVRNTTIEGCYYPVYCQASGDSSTVWIENCSFKQDQEGYALWSYGSVDLHVKNSSFDGFRGGSLYGETTIEDCVFKNFNATGGALLVSSKPLVQIRCSRFENLKGRGPALELRGNNNLIITDNTFDSCDAFMQIGCSQTGIFKIERNNFLHYTRATIEDGILCNLQLGEFNKLNLSNNYWGTTDTNAIQDGIDDFNDDISNGILVDYSNYSSTPFNSSSCKTHTGIKRLDEFQVGLYPNPVSGILHVTLPQNKAFIAQIFDLNGQLLYTSDHEDIRELEVDCTLWPNACYIFRIEVDGQVSYSKFIKGN